ncbi:hypothetical protein MIR68_011318 [Amoeboaphelidium protococcarum]|nr:hypothetical protein MIR68_011318 [Amoeboaphelidium protococcarum]
MTSKQNKRLLAPRNTYQYKKAKDKAELVQRMKLKRAYHKLLKKEGLAEDRPDKMNTEQKENGGDKKSLKQSQISDHQSGKASLLNGRSTVQSSTKKSLSPSLEAIRKNTSFWENTHTTQGVIGQSEAGPADLSALDGFQMQPNYFDSDGLIKTKLDLISEGVSPENAELLQEYSKTAIRNSLQSRFLTDDSQLMSEEGRQRVAKALNMSPEEVAEQEAYARGRAPSPDFPPNSMTNHIRSSIYHGGRMLDAFELDDQGNPIRLRDDSALQQQGWTDEEIQNLKQSDQYLDQELQERAKTQGSPGATETGQPEGTAASTPQKEQLRAPAAGDGTPTPSADQVGASNPQIGNTPTDANGANTANAEGNDVQAADSSQDKSTISDHIKAVTLHGKSLIDAFEVDEKGNPTGLKDMAALEADGWTSDEIKQWIQPRAEQLNQELNSNTRAQTKEQPDAPVAMNSESTSTPEPSSEQEAQAKNPNTEDTLPPNLQQQDLPSAPSADANGAKVQSDLPGDTPAPVPVAALGVSPPAETAAVAPKVKSQQDTGGDQKPETGPSAGAQQESVGNNAFKKPTTSQQPGQSAEVKAPSKAPVQAPVKAPTPAKAPVKAPTPVKTPTPAKAPAVPQKPAKTAPAASKPKTGSK